MNRLFVLPVSAASTLSKKLSLLCRDLLLSALRANGLRPFSAEAFFTKGLASTSGVVISENHNTTGQGPTLFEHQQRGLGWCFIAYYASFGIVGGRRVSEEVLIVNALPLAFCSRRSMVIIKRMAEIA